MFHLSFQQWDLICPLKLRKQSLFLYLTNMFGLCALLILTFSGLTIMKTWEQQKTKVINLLLTAALKEWSCILSFPSSAPSWAPAEMKEKQRLQERTKKKKKREQGRSSKGESPAAKYFLTMHLKRILMRDLPWTLLCLWRFPVLFFLMSPFACRKTVVQFLHWIGV